MQNLGLWDAGPIFKFDQLTFSVKKIFFFFQVQCTTLTSYTSGIIIPVQFSVDHPSQWAGMEVGVIMTRGPDPSTPRMPHFHHY